jgi:hypothetical protein
LDSGHKTYCCRAYSGLDHSTYIFLCPKNPESAEMPCNPATLCGIGLTNFGLVSRRSEIDLSLGIILYFDHLYSRRYWYLRIRRGWGETGIRGQKSGRDYMGNARCFGRHLAASAPETAIQPPTSNLPKTSTYVPVQHIRTFDSRSSLTNWQAWHQKA